MGETRPASNFHHQRLKLAPDKGMLVIFKNAPKMVEDRVRQLPFWARVPSHRYVAAAHLLVTFYVGRAVLNNDNDPFLRFRPQVRGGTNWEYSARVVQMATILFDIRHEPGFEEICRRMSSRNLEQAHSELSSAALFWSHGFAVLARPEISVAQKDFDFSISAQSVDANVEVWQATRPTFDAEALRKRLQDKKAQLPPDKPAILVCVYPEHWLDQVDGLGDELEMVAMRFFGGSSRINCVMFAHEEFNDVGQAGTLKHLSFMVAHPNPANPCPELIEMLVKPPPARPDVDALVAQKKNAATIQTQHEFFRWVNWMIDGA